MSFYSWAFNDLEDPYWACYYGVDTHPLYHKCNKCPSRSRCNLLDDGFEVRYVPYQPPKPPPPMPHQDVTGDQLFAMLWRDVKQFFRKLLPAKPKNNPIQGRRND